MSTASLVAPRGEITDANGVALATTVERYVIWVDQTKIATWKRTLNGTVVAEGPAGAAEVLAPLLGMDAGELGMQLLGDKTYVEIRRGVLPDVWRAIRTERITGVEADRSDERVYPAGAVGGNVVGFLNRDGEGLAGLERALDEQLTGVDGTYRYERGAGGQEIPGGAREQTPAQPGRDVRTTLLRDLQWKAQEAVDQQVATTGADSGALVAMDVTTGEILALVDSGSVDPNDPGVTAADRRGSRAISDVFEPGSTAKVITMAAALETGVTDPLRQWMVPYEYTTANGQTFKDSHEHDGMKLTTTGVLAESSNTGTVMIGQEIPQQVRYDYLAKFGFGTKTGLELQGESPGILHPAEAWDGRTKYAVLFGQGVSVNAVQATQVFATIANGGVRMPAHLVDVVHGRGRHRAPGRGRHGHAGGLPGHRGHGPDDARERRRRGHRVRGGHPRLPGRRQDRHRPGVGRQRPGRHHRVLHRRRAGGRPAHRGRRHHAQPAQLGLGRDGGGPRLQRGRRVRAPAAQGAAERVDTEPLPDDLRVIRA